MAKKRILFLITKANWGGAQRYVFDLATHVPREDFDVMVASGNRGTLTEKLESAGIEVTSIANLKRDISLGDELLSFFRLVRIIREYRPDILHLNSSKAGGLGALAGRLAGVRNIIFTAHGWPFKEERVFILRWMIYTATWFTVLLSHKTIVVSKGDEELGKQMWLVSKKITYTPIALKSSSEMLDRPLAEQRLSFGISGNPAPYSKYRLVTIAELTKNKGILPYGVEMIRELEQRSPGTYSYTVFGDGDDLPTLQKLATGLPIYFEIVYPTDASQYLKAFDIFVLPSIKEGLPYVLLEAMAAGLPIVATNVVESEMKNIPNVSIVEIKSATALADAVEKLAATLPGTRQPTSGYSFKKMLEETTALYRS